jgi:hypothetical protein
MENGYTDALSPCKRLNPALRNVAPSAALPDVRSAFMRSPYPPTRRRLWPIFVPFLLVVTLAAVWVGLWFYAASAAETAIAGWREREAKAGRIYECAQQTIGGFPFRFEVRCSNPTVELRNVATPLVFHGADAVVLAQIYQPTLLIGEFTGPVTVAEPGRPPSYVANWTLAQSSVRGTPRSPQRLSIVFDNPAVQRPGEGAGTTILAGKRIELHGRMLEGSATSNPVIELVLRTTAAVAPELHPLAAVPIDSEIFVILRGLADFSPKPWPARLRELHERNGRLEITKARVQQGDVIAVSSGTLALNERGNLDGQLQMTVVNIEQLIKALDLETTLSKGQIGKTIDKLDRLIPGLADIARKHATPGVLAALQAIGKRTTLEGKPAMTVPLRFDDGRVLLGPIPIGRAPPLF